MNRRGDQSSGATKRPTIDDLLDRAIEAINRGDKATAQQLARKVLTVDRDNPDAEDLLLAAPTETGEIRRLTIMFADLVDSTALSTRIEPEVYRTVVGRYKDLVRHTVEGYEGHIATMKGDGLLAVFGHPRAHENDVARAVHAGLTITREVARLSERVRRRFGFSISCRVGIHRGVVYLDKAQDDVYGLAANLSARVSGLAPPGTVVVSNAIERLVRNDFEIEARPAQAVKGIEELVEHHRVIAEKADPARIALGPIVGRGRELAYLDAAWAQAQAGTLATPGIGFLGEPGMGKSRLATACADLAEQSGAVVLALLGSPFHADAGLHPIRALLEQRCRIGRDTEREARLTLLDEEIRARSLDPAIVVPLLAPALGITGDTGHERVTAEGAKLYERITAAVRDYLLACLDGGPGVVLAEDLQWFDSSTLDIVKSILKTDTGRLVVMVTTRDRAPAADLPHMEWFDLAPLTAHETDALIDALNPTLTAGQRAEVRRRCDGVPLYIEEVVTKLDEQPTDASEWTRVPDTLYEPLFARLRGNSKTVPVIEAAATIGREVDRSLLMSVVPMADDEVNDVIDELKRAGVFLLGRAGSVRFRHELLREVAAELPPPSQRRLLHERVADALASSEAGPPDWSVVALHYHHAERFADAAGSYQRAAGDARRRGALSEARNHLTKAITHLERMAPGADRDEREITVRLRRGFLTSAAAGPTSQEAAADFERCLQLSGGNISAKVLATLSALFGYYMSRGDLPRAVQLLESTREIAFTRGPKWLQLANDVGFGTAAWYAGDFNAARTRFETLAAGYEDVDASAIESEWFMLYEPVASMHVVLALSRFVQGDFAGAESAFSSAQKRCEELGFPHGPFSLAYSHSVEIWVRCEAGQLDLAGERVDDIMQCAERYGFDAWQLIGAAERALVDAFTALASDPIDSANLPQHIETLSGFVQVMDALEVKPFLGAYDAVLAQLLMAVGEPAKARQQLDAALRRSDEIGIRFLDAELLRLRARTGDGADRDADLRAAIQLASEQGAAIFQLRAATDYFEVAEEHDSAEVLRDALHRFPDESTWPELTRAQAMLR